MRFYWKNFDGWGTCLYPKIKSKLIQIFEYVLNRKIGIKVGPVNRIELYVNQNNPSNDEANMDVSLKNMLGDSNLDWIFTKDNFVKIDIDSYPALTKLQKYELALAHYSTIEIV